MPVDEVKPGMRGTGISVFEGETRAEFQVEILGTLPNAVGPRRHLILARLSGQRLADTGVMQGMSGSPVYIDGRLDRRGVLLAGRLLEGADRRHHADRRHDRRHRPHAPAPRRRSRSAAARHRPGRPRRRSSRRRCADAFARITSASAPIALAGVDAPVLAALADHAQLRPIAVAYTMAGFSGDTAAAFTRALGATGRRPRTRPRASRRRHGRRRRRWRPATPSASA